MVCFRATAILLTQIKMAEVMAANFYPLYIVYVDLKTSAN